MSRRYAFKSAEPLARDADLTLQMTPLTSTTSAARACKPAPTGLYWFSDLTGAFDQDVEAAYLLAEGAAGPLLGLARVLGETCDDVTWTTTWTPASGESGAPGLIEEGASLIVYPLADTLPGILSVTALCAGLSFGPILLTVLRYSVYCYCPPPMSLNWYAFATVFSAANVTGMTWGPNPIATASSSFTADLTRGESYQLASTKRVRVSFTPNEPVEWQIQFKFGDDVSWYLYSTDAMPVIWDVAPADFATLYGFFPYLQPPGQLTLEIECYGP